MEPESTLGRIHKILEQERIHDVRVICIGSTASWANKERREICLGTKDLEDPYTILEEVAHMVYPDHGDAWKSYHHELMRRYVMMEWLGS